MSELGGGGRGEARAYRDAMMAEAPPGKRENVERLWGVLEEMALQGERRFSVASVGERFQSAGGLKTQSLRNQAGAEYRRLIELFAAAGSGSAPAARPADPVEAALGQIADMSVRATLRQALAEAKGLRLANARLQSALKKCSISEEAVPSGRDSESAARAAPLPPAFDPWMAAVLARGMDPGRLSEKRLRVTDNGAIEDDSGAALFPPGFADAINALIKPGRPSGQ